MRRTAFGYAYVGGKAREGAELQVALIINKPNEQVMRLTVNGHPAVINVNPEAWD